MTKIIFIVLTIFLFGCSDHKYLTADEIIIKCKKCQEQGMGVRIYSNIIGQPARVKCVPTDKQTNP
jgi:hypothetical protein